MSKILVVEDEIAIAKLLEAALSSIGHSVDYILDGEQAANHLETHHYDLVLLDIMLPHVDGYELFAYVKTMNTPVIFITAKGSLQDRVKGLRMGAEDYIVKPFEIEELLARVEGALRRSGHEHILHYGTISIDSIARTIHNADTQIALTKKEYALFLLLVANQGIALSRDRILEEIWEDHDVQDSRTLDIHIRQLRRKLDLAQEIETVYRYGYRLKDLRHENS